MSRVLITITFFLFIVSFLLLIKELVNQRRSQALKRLRELKFVKSNREEHILEQPLFERTIGTLAKKIVNFISRVTPNKALKEIQDKLEKAGSPKKLKASDFLAVQGILGVSIAILSLFLFDKTNTPLSMILLLTITLSLLAIYVPWFILAKLATQIKTKSQKSLPDMIDLLVISVEAGLSFDMALQKVVERFKGPLAKEFQKMLGEIQLGRSRKDALKSMAKRLDMPSFTTLANAIVQSEQLGVGLGSVLRLQADLVREKRQQQIEEQAMKAPIKMLFPLVFFLLPSMFIILLGPAILNIMKALGGN